MRLPRDLSADEIVEALKVLGYISRDELLERLFGNT